MRLQTLVLTTAFFAAGAHAAPIYDANVTPDVIFGSGNANGSFTVDRASGVEVGLRGKLRHNAAGAPENTFNSNGDGTYSFAKGVAPTQSSPTGVWSFEWSINVNYDNSANGRALDDLTYALGIDGDASQGTAFTMFDVINAGYLDHAIGTNASGNGGGTKAADLAAYQALIANNNVAQNSWKAHWFVPFFDPTVDGTYNFFLAAYDGTAELARTEIQIIVGDGGAAQVPEPASLALAGLALAGLAASRRRRA